MIAVFIFPPPAPLPESWWKNQERKGVKVHNLHCYREYYQKTVGGIRGTDIHLRGGDRGSRHRAAGVFKARRSRGGGMRR
jgi:hypothetical protein